MKSAWIAPLLIIATAATAIAANPEWDQATRLYNFGDYKGALTAFRKIADKTPSEPTVHYMLAQCYKNSGNTKQAIVELEWISRSTSDKRVKGPADALLAQLRPSSGGGATTAGAHSSTSASAPGADFPPLKNFIGDSAAQTVGAAAKKGWAPCRGSDCLNFGTSGWHHEEVAGHPPTDMWMSWKVENDEGTRTGSYSQAHIGELIKEGKDVGPCPVCKGSGWVRSK
ncbi:hypothetical protein BH10CYA1_BH10CYA1_23870 [soil metagenome]